MQDIKEKQNKLNNLRIQFSARFHYNKAEIISYVLWITCIIEVAIAFYSDNFEKNITILIFAFITIVIVAMQIGLSHHVKIASALRKYFDYKVFGLQHSKFYNSIEKTKLNEISITCEDKHSKIANLNYQNSGKDKFRGVKDWYTDIPEDIDLYEKIIFCQIQNLYWDEKMTKISGLLLKIFIFVTIILFFTFFLSTDPFENLIKILMMLPLICKTVHEIINIRDSKKINQIANDVIENRSENNIEIILEVQELINERRSLLSVTSKLVHKIKSTMFHKLFNQLNNIKD